MRLLFTRTGAVAAVTAGLMLVAAGGASAHECFVAKRSAQGNASVSAHSAAWFTITPEILFGEFIGLTGDDLSCAVDAWNANPDLPAYIVVGGKQAVGQGGVIAENNPNMEAKGLGSNGTGIEHAEDVFTPAIGEILASCGIAPPGP
jgi:hypothetical protein